MLCNFSKIGLEERKRDRETAKNGPFATEIAHTQFILLFNMAENDFEPINIFMNAVNNQFYLKMRFFFSSISLPTVN